MKLGYVHACNGSPGESGVTRYGRILAREASRRAGLQVRDQDLVFFGEIGWDREAVRACGAALRGVALLHVQFSRYLWGIRDAGGLLIQELQQSVRAPMVVTIHDVQTAIYPDENVLTLFRASYREVQPARRGLLWSLWRAFRSVQHGYLEDRRTLRRIAHRSARAIVCTDEERRRLLPFFGRRPIAVIPHFIEQRKLEGTRDAARRALGLDAAKVIVLLGFVYPGKGHEVALRALGLLPPEYRLVFAGGTNPGGERYLRQLEQHARSLGVEQRVRVTGFLAEADLDRYLLAADAAICPFLEMSASGSLSTWLSVASIPIIASDLPQIQFYNATAPGAITVFPPGDHRALSEAVTQAFADAHQGAREKLRKALSVSEVLDEHLRLYRSLLADAAA